MPLEETNKAQDAFTILCFFLSGPAWTRTRDLFLIREARCFSDVFPTLQSTCKRADSRENAFPMYSGSQPRLLHG